MRWSPMWAREGYDPRFGGRSINRFVKERVEQYLADRIIAGAIAPGSTVVLEPEELVAQQVR